MIPRLFLLLSSAVFFLIGINTFIDPQKAVIGLDLHLSSVTAFNEMRANYGGMHLGMGLMLLVAAFKKQYRLAGLWLVCIFTGGLLFGRAVSMFLDGRPNDVLWSITLFELVAVALGAIAITIERKKRL